MRVKTMVMLQSTLDEESIVEGLNNKTAEVVQSNYSTLDNVLQLIGLVLLLVVILAAAYYTSRFIGTMKLGQLKNSNFNVIDTYRISQNKMLQIVKIANKYVVIAIGKDSINYVMELDEAEVFTKEANPKELQSFKQVLDKLRNKKE